MNANDIKMAENQELITHDERNWSFSYEPPEGWFVVTLPNLKFNASMEPNDTGFAPNIVVTSQFSNAPLPEFVNQSIANNKKVSGAKVIGPQEFSSPLTDNVIKIAFGEWVCNGQRLQQHFYYFGVNNRKIEVACSASPGDWSRLDSVFDEAMKTLKLYSNESEHNGNHEKKSGCFIATAVFDSPSSPEVELLRNFRDRVLLNSIIGKLFVKIYYIISPPIASFIEKTKVLKPILKLCFFKPLLHIIRRS